MNSTSNYRRRFRSALASVFKTSLLGIWGYTIVGTVLSVSAGVALSAGCAHRVEMYVPDSPQALAPPAGEDPSTETSVTRLSEEPPQYRALEEDGVKGGEIVSGVPGTPKDVLASERTASWDYGTPVYGIPLMGRNDKNPFSPVDSFSHDGDFSTEWPMAGEDFFSVAKFLFPSTGSHWEVGGFRIRFGFEDNNRRHDPIGRLESVHLAHW